MGAYGFSGAPGAIRTPDPLVRSQILYPTELRVRIAACFECCESRIWIIVSFADFDQYFMDNFYIFLINIWKLIKIKCFLVI